MSTDETPLDASLRALPRAEVPPHLATAIMARIARIEDARRAAPVPEFSAGRPWAGWATAVGAAIAAGALVIAMASGQPAIGAGTYVPFFDLESSAGSLVLLALGLALYLTGLFAGSPPERRER